MSFQFLICYRISRDLYFLKKNINPYVLDDVAKLTKLETLKVNYNWLVGTLPTQLLALKHLTDLEIVGNLRLSETSVPLDLKLSASAKFNLNLKRLVLRDLQGGQIPDELYRSTSLTALDLSSNDLTGTLSTKLGLLSRLEYLSVWGNYLKGTFPTEIGLLTNLRVLYVNYNQFEGTMPQFTLHGEAYTDISPGDEFEFNQPSTPTPEPGDGNGRKGLSFAEQYIIIVGSIVALIGLLIVLTCLAPNSPPKTSTNNVAVVDENNPVALATPVTKAIEDDEPAQSDTLLAGPNEFNFNEGVIFEEAIQAEETWQRMDDENLVVDRIVTEENAQRMQV